MQTESDAREEIELENKILQLSSEQLAEAEQETFDLFSTLFRDKNGAELDTLRDTYFNWVVDPGWHPSPLNPFFEPDSSPEKFNAAGSMSGAFDLLAILKLGLSPEILEI